MSGESEHRKGVESLKNFERALGHVRKSVRPLTLMSREEVGSCVSAADRAKLNLQVAYGVSSLFYMFLRTQGVSPVGHPVKAELDRIRKYFARLKQAGKPAEQRAMKVDVDASRRFINAALASDSVWQNAKATDPASAREKRTQAGIGRTGPAGAPENTANNSGDGTTAGGGAGTGTPAGSAAAGGANAGKKALSGNGGGSSSSTSSGSGSKRKHEAAADSAGDGDDGRVSAAKGGGGKGKRRSDGGGSGKGGGGGGGSAGGGSAAAEPPQQWGDRPQAGVPGEAPRAAKKAKGTAGGKNKKKTSNKMKRYHAW